jgi:nicotinamide phosphoribosyltransferase
MKLVHPLLRTDVYKMGHMEQYAPGTTRVISYLNARSDKYFEELLFFGLQYYLMEYLTQPITTANVEDFLKRRRRILGSEPSDDIKEKLHGIADLGQWPVEISAVPEGTVLPVKNALLTLESTHDDFPWAPGFLESLLLKVWYPCTVATNSLEYYRIARRYSRQPLEFNVHDFGYRSDTSEESAAISGAAHLIVFRGSDTIVAEPFIEEYYSLPTESPCMMSVPASEHSVMCSYGREFEFEAFERMLELYPDGYVSIVSDTYSIWHVCTNILPRLKDKILARNGRVIIRPDSGYPPDIICGDAKAEPGTPEAKGVLVLLDELFGSERLADSPYRILNPKIGLIYGDGMYHQRYEETLIRSVGSGYDGSNIVIGAGGLLRAGTRDTLGMAIKATQITRNGRNVNIFKDPITDSGKKSHVGRVALRAGVTYDSAPPDAPSELMPVFRNGQILRRYTFDEVRRNFHASVQF